MTSHCARRRIAFYSLPFAWALLPNAAHALDWGVQPRLDVGGMYYNLDIKGDIGQLTGIDQIFDQPPLEAIETVMPLVSGGATVFVDRFFLDLSAQGAFAGESDFIDRTDVTGGATRRTTGSTDLDRQEYALSAGMQVAENIAFFGGYKFARTNIDNIRVTDIRSGDPDSVFDFEDQYTFDNRFDQQGFFFGGSIGTEVGGAGFLSLKIAIAFMGGEMKITGRDDFGTPNLTVDQDPFTFNIDNTIKGDTTGVNVGLSWIGAIPQVKGLSYTLSVDGYRYEFKGTFNEDAFDPPSFSETVARFTAGVAYTF